MSLGTIIALIIGEAGASTPELINELYLKLILAFAINVFVVAIKSGYLIP